MSNHSPKVRKVIAFILTLTLSSFGAVNTGSILAAENTENTTGNTTGNTKAGDARENSQQVGQMIVTGSVTVNEKEPLPAQRYLLIAVSLWLALKETVRLSILEGWGVLNSAPGLNCCCASVMG